MLNKNKDNYEQITGKEDNKYLMKIDKIQKDLQKTKYRFKFYQLTQSHVFHFDIYRIITDKNQDAINKLCNCFYRFLVLRMLCQYHQNYKSGSQSILKPTSHKIQQSQSKINKANSIESNNYGNQIRQVKNRANTTVMVSKKNDRIQTFARKQKLKNQTQVSYKNKTQAIEELNLDLIGCISEQQQLALKIVQTIQQLKQAYFLLNQTCGNKSRVAKIQIICFLVALISPDILYPFVQSIQKQFTPKNFKRIEKDTPTVSIHEDANAKQKYDIEEEVYIVLTYQTLGNLVSPNVFTYLKKKYVKQTIFQSCPQQSYIRLVRSLKHIKQKLTSQKDIVLIKGRKQRQIQKLKLRRLNSIQQQVVQPFSKQKMKLFIRDALKTKDTIDINKPIKSTPKQDQLEALTTKLRQSFYPSYSLNKIPPKMSLPKESPTTKHSISIKIKLNLQNIKQNKNKQIKRRKYVSNIHKTFYKLKSPNQNKKNNSNKFIRSQRPSHKFNQIPIQNDYELGTHTIGIDKDCIQHMKTKISKFKDEALKDLETIQQFKPNKLMLRQKSKQNQQYPLHEQWGSTYHVRKASSVLGNSNTQNMNLTEMSRNQNKKYKIGLMTNTSDKQQVTWHAMYNIRTQPMSTTKSVQIPKIVYKLSKNSDKLRKFQKQFERQCIKRVQVLEDQIDLVERLQVI